MLEDLTDGHGEVDGEAELLEDAAVDLCVGCAGVGGEEGCIPRVPGEVHLNKDGGDEWSQEVPYRGLNNGQCLVAVCLPGHDDVAGDRGRETAPYDEADKECGIHEVLVRGARRDDGEDRRGGHEEALKRDEEVDPPAGVVLDEHTRGECASRD